MGRKRSLGHNPIGFNFDDGLTYDFIPNLNEQIVKEVEHPEKQEESKIQNKTIVSYYIEENIIDRIKLFAKLTEQSYSSVATNAFEDFLHKEGFKI
jgi:nitrogenase subunit NifH